MKENENNLLIVIYPLLDASLSYAHDDILLDYFCLIIIFELLII